MEQKDKDLLLKDLCARLSHGVKISVNDKVETLQGINILDTVVEYDSCLSSDIEEVKPYLFPLSSMTDAQCKELRNLIHEHFTLEDEFNEGICFKTYGDILVWLDEKPINQCYFIFDWLNKNHFDYRCLIDKGLAIDATNLNIY